MAWTASVSADDHFALAVGAHDMLVVFGPKGERIAELPVPSISQPVTIGSTSFQVSYGRDANNLLTAILAPNPSQPQDLHFNVLNKAVDADKEAVVTLTFSNGLSHVSVDPGYVGVVSVNSQSVRHREIADESPSPASVPDMAPEPRTTSTVAPRDLPSSAPTSYEPSPTSDMTSTTPAPAPDVNSTMPAPAPADTGLAAAAPPSNQPLFWSEPITAPDGTAPRIGLDQMKLVEVQGSVSIKLANGDIRDGRDGMVLPSGATVMSSDSSSAAVFMGGVNSARLLSNTDVKVSQNMEGTVRKTTLDLKDGTVFSRVGRRPGETQDYQVRTPEGVAAARGTEYATTVKNGHTYVFVAKGSVAMFEGGREYKMVLGSSNIGRGVMPPESDAEVAATFVAVIDELQAYNGKLATVIAAVNAGTATPQQQAYYQSVLALSGPVVGQALANITALSNNPNPLPQDYALSTPFVRNFVRTIYQDFLPFGNQPTTPY